MIYFCHGRAVYSREVEINIRINYCMGEYRNNKSFIKALHSIDNAE